MNQDNKNNLDLEDELVNDGQPHISINAQYIKDLSFESPGVPATLGNREVPEVGIELDLYIQQMEEENFEVSLHINATATKDQNKVFVVELLYAGLFTLTNFAAQHKKVVLSTHCPALIFPFARKIIADVTQEGGFQPLMIDPINFSALYQKKLEQELQQQEQDNYTPN